MLRDYWIHIRECATIRGLLRRHDSENLRSLYWYDMPLHQAVGLRGILRVLWWALFRRTRDEISGNYGVVNLYHADAPDRGRTVSAATVWDCRGLKTQPWFDGETPGRTALEANADAIIAEFKELQSHISSHPDNRSLVQGGEWRGAFLYQANGIKHDRNCALCPETTRVIESLPICKPFGFVEFSVLQPGTHIEHHSGWSNLRQRHHLGIEVPEAGTVRIRVGEEERSWQQGKCLVFDDSYDHEVFHEGEKPRVVLIVDLWHPSLSASDVECLSHKVFQRFGKAKN